MKEKDNHKAKYKNIFRGKDPGVGLHARNKEVLNEPEEHEEGSDSDICDTESQTQEKLEMAPIRDRRGKNPEDAISSASARKQRCMNLTASARRGRTAQAKSASSALDGTKLPIQEVVQPSGTHPVPVQEGVQPSSSQSQPVQEGVQPISSQSQRVEEGASQSQPEIKLHKTFLFLET